MQPFSDPFEFYHASGELNQLREGFRNDMRKAASELPVRQTSAGIILQFQIKHGAVVFPEYTAIRLRGKHRIWLMHYWLKEKTELFWLVSAPQFQNRKVRKNYALNFP